MLLNLSNHPSSAWSPEQIAAAGGKDNIVDMPFPQIDPDGDEMYIQELVDDYCKQIVEKQYVSSVHIMGEMNFTFALITKLKALKIRCIASTTKRDTVEEYGVKTSKFKFVRFREYV